MKPTEIGTAPTWIQRITESLPCSGCGGADAAFVGVYARPGVSRVVGYRVCDRCAEDLDAVIVRVEDRVRQLEAIEACCISGAPLGVA